MDLLARLTKKEFLFPMFMVVSSVLVVGNMAKKTLISVLYALKAHMIR